MVIQHTCGATIPADVESYVRHLASCPETREQHAGWARAVVNTVAYELSQTETATETRDLSPAEMAALHQDGKPEGESLRDIARLAGVAPETVRRRIKKWKGENGL